MIDLLHFHIVLFKRTGDQQRCHLRHGAFGNLNDGSHVECDAVDRDGCQSQQPATMMLSTLPTMINPAVPAKLRKLKRIISLQGKVRSRWYQKKK